MRILVPILLVVVIAVAVVLATRDDEEPYLVRAIFDNAGFVIPGEDVKVAGVKVGKIDSLDVTDDFKAVVVLKIDDEAYQDFRRDAECMVRPQSLIGEKFVECEPTQARQANSEPPPALDKIEDGEGEGQYLLPVSQTSKPVDLDLINNITRQPQQARLSIILSELGAGVAGRGKDLNDVIRRANPALKEVDKVLEILASENDTLQKLAVNGDTVLAPLARERERVSSALENSAEVAQATAERSDDLEADIARLPAFLRELRPTMVRLGAFADEATPVFADLGAQAPSINRFVAELGPFAAAGIPAFESLGDAARIGTPAITAALPITRDLRAFAKQVRPVGETTAALLGSLQQTRGFERFLDYAFYQVAAINGFDTFGHYLRAGLIVNQCSTYAVSPTPGCTANFAPASATAAAASGPAGPRDQTLIATAEAIRRAMAGWLGERPPRLQATPTPSPERTGGRERRPGKSAPAATATPAPSATAAPQATASPHGGEPPAPAPAATPEPATGGDDPLLDFLFGKDQP
jgi:phospholipid/cholesterol/gamma-HCH transport system substrate-binding protein